MWLRITIRGCVRKLQGHGSTGTEGTVEKGKLGLGKLFVGARGSVRKKPAFVWSAACRTLFFLGDTNLLLFGSFFSKIKNLGIYICSLQQVLIHCSGDE